MFKGLLAKFILIAMPVFVALNGVFLTGYAYYRLDVLRSDLAAETASLGFRLGKGISRPLAQGDAKTVSSVLATLAGNRSIHCAVVRSKDGSMVTAWPFPGCEEAVETSGRVDQVDIPIRQKRKTIGSLSVGFNEAWSMEALQKELGYIGVALLFASSIAFLACLAAHRVTIGRPLGRLLTGIDRRIKAGSHDQVDWASDDELGRVIAVYNDMTTIEQQRLQDITATTEALKLEVEERRAKERALQEAHAHLLQKSKMEAVGSMAAGIAHEINTPLQYMSTNLSYLRDGFADIDGVLAVAHGLESENAGALKQAMERHDIDFLRDEYPEAIAQAQAGIDQVASIVGAVKQFSQADQGRHERIDLADVIRNALELSRRTWSAVADVVVDADEPLSPIHGNAAALGQVVINLIVNASDAIAEGPRGGRGKITVHLVEGDRNITLSVGDDGVGIAPEHLNRVFDLFFTTKPPGEGTGQGLAVAHTIITQEHGGALSVESKPGQGTTFSIVLPKALEMAA